MGVMEISKVGHSCFKIKTKQLTIITDPFTPEAIGLKAVKQQGDLVLVSHEHADHNNVELVKGKGDVEPIVISGPGEYEVKDALVTGWKTYHDADEGRERGKNTVYKILVDGVEIVHLGDLGHVLSDEMVDNLGNIHVLFIPVGGKYTIDPDAAVKVIKQLEPYVIVPMHYNVPDLSQEMFGELATVDRFLEALGMEGERVDKFSISDSTIPLDTKVYVVE